MSITLSSFSEFWFYAKCQKIEFFVKNSVCLPNYIYRQHLMLHIIGISKYIPISCLYMYKLTYYLLGKWRARQIIVDIIVVIIFFKSYYDFVIIAIYYYIITDGRIAYFFIIRRLTRGDDYFVWPAAVHYENTPLLSGDPSACHT